MMKQQVCKLTCQILAIILLLTPFISHADITMVEDSAKNAVLLLIKLQRYAENGVDNKTDGDATSLAGIFGDRSIQNQNNIVANTIIRENKARTSAFNNKLKMAFQPAFDSCDTQTIITGINGDCNTYNTLQNFSPLEIDDLFNNKYKQIDGNNPVNIKQTNQLGSMPNKKLKTVLNPSILLFDGPYTLSKEQVEKQKEFIQLLSGLPSISLDKRQATVFSGESKAVEKYIDMARYSASVFPLKNTVVEMTSFDGKPSKTAFFLDYGSKFIGKYGFGGKAWLKELNGKDSLNSKLLREQLLLVSYRNLQMLKQFEATEQKVTQNSIKLITYIAIDQSLQENRGHQHAR